MQHDFILLDRSGSMAEGGKWAETLGAVNSYVSKLAAEKVDTGVTLAVFDDPANGIAFEIIRDRITPSTWHEVTVSQLQPRGYTPLNDAVGQLVTLANKGAPNGTQYDKVAIVIVTDGLENASKEYTHDAAKKMLDECRGRGWQVIFIGANFDNAQQASGYGNSARQTVYSSTRNMSPTFSMMATARAAYGATGQSMSFSDEEKEQLAKDEDAPAA